MATVLMKSIKEISMQNNVSPIKTYENVFEHIFCIYNYMINENNDINLFEYFLVFFEYINLISYIFQKDVSK